MKFIATSLFMLCIASFTFAQQAVKADAGAYKAKNEGWITSVDEAYALSKKTNKPIMANFTGSDWCGWCIRLTKNVFSKPEFKEWAAENVILLELDFPRRSKLPADLQQQNRQMQQAFQVRGFPTVWVFDLDKADGQYKINALGKTGYTPTVKQFTDGVDEIITTKRKS